MTACGQLVHAPHLAASVMIGECVRMCNGNLGQIVASDVYALIDESERPSADKRYWKREPFVKLRLFARVGNSFESKTYPNLVAANEVLLTLTEEWEPAANIAAVIFVAAARDANAGSYGCEFAGMADAFVICREVSLHQRRS